MKVVAAHKRDIFGNAKACFKDYLNRGKRNGIVVAEDAIGPIRLEQTSHRIVALLPVLSIRGHVGTYQAGIEIHSVLLERLFVSLVPAQSSGKFQAANVRDPLASHGNEMFRCNATDSYVVDADKVGLEAGKVAIDENKWNFLLRELFEFLGGWIAGRNDQTIKTMRKMLFDGRFLNDRI